MSQPRRLYGTDAPVIAVPFPAITASQQLVGRDCVLMGWAVIESTGAASAEVDFLDGGDDTGALLAPISLTAGQSARDTLSSWGVAANSGVRARIVSGSVRGVVYVVLS